MVTTRAWKPRRDGCECAAWLRLALWSAGFVLGATAVGAACAEEPAADISPSSAPAGEESTPRESEKGKTEAAPDLDRPKNYAIPALEIFGFDFLLNQYDRHHIGSPYHSNLSSITHNLHHGWVVDNDPFSTNQFGHPYQGSIYHGFARSAGLDYWESFAYTFAGSALWELAGETTPPSRNDQIASGIAGSFLGEALFRMANLMLEQGGGVPPFWRELGAAAISPSMGFNRVVMGDRYATSFASHEPTYYGRLQLGVSGTTQNVSGTSTKLKRDEALADFSLDYGLPGKPGYTYTRPFDYFSFQTTASSANGVENIMTRGLLFGTDYAAGEGYRGLWGIYGSYDYIAPQTFRVSSTALSLGTTGQWWLSDAVALQGSTLAGAGYAAVGTLHGAREGDYHYGVAPQALVAMRLLFADKASFDVTAREYFLTRVASANSAGRDNIVRADASFTLRLHRQHAVTIKYLWNRRDASYPDLGDRLQTRATIGIFYTLLGHDRFGVVDWR